MKLTSIFQHNQDIPSKYTCQGEDINPPLTIEDIPEKTKTLVLIVDDPDAPNNTWDHWIVFNIPPTNQIQENTEPGTSGINSWGKTGYGGPCPPSGKHRYFFKLFALDTELSLTNPKKEDVLTAMQGHILDKAELVGLYKKN